MKKIAFFTLIFILITLSGFSYSVALMITGEIGGNPIYEMMRDGAVKAANEENIDLKIVEGGYNNSKWEQSLIALAATGKYDLVITFTEGMPASVNKASRMFPNQKFALIDGAAGLYDNVFSLSFKDEEMTYIAGYFAALVTLSDMKNANNAKRIGLIAGDIYPAMTEKMLPGFKNGAKSVDDDIDVDFSVAGSWGDPNKGRELAAALFDNDVDIVLSISGGTGVGIIQAAAEKGKYFIGVDSNIISYSPETILACTLKKADEAIYNVIKRASKGDLPFGTVERWGIMEGVISFTFNDENYIRNVPEFIREKMLDLYNSFLEGEIEAIKQ